MIAIKTKMLSNAELSVLCLELAQILQAGLLISEGFSLVAQQQADESGRAMLLELAEATADGGGVYAAMNAAGVFPAYLLRMVQVGEQTGALERVFRALAAYYTRQAQLRQTIRSAVAYPLLLLVIVLAVFFVFLVEVMPVFQNVFNQLGVQMLPAAQVFLNIGLWLARSKWVLLAVLAALAAVIVTAYCVPALHTRCAAFFRRRFSRGKTGRTITAARLASVLALTLSGASDIHEAMDMALEFSRDFDQSQGLEQCAQAVAGGASLSQAAREAGLFGGVYCRMIAIGEQTGAADQMMQEVARRTQNDMDTAIDTLTGRIEPGAVILLTVLVGFLLLTVMLPLVGIMAAL